MISMVSILHQSQRSMCKGACDHPIEEKQKTKTKIRNAGRSRREGREGE